jgi:LytS/YehU family sensor histidine kinase
LLKSQLNPHFLFNALQSIQNFIHKNDKEKSSAYLTNYAKLIRLVLENSDQNTVTVHDDKLALIAYLELQQLTHNNSFSYEVTVLW